MKKVFRHPAEATQVKKNSIFWLHLLFVAVIDKKIDDPMGCKKFTEGNFVGGAVVGPLIPVNPWNE